MGFLLWTKGSYWGWHGNENKIDNYDDWLMEFMCENKNYPAKLQLTSSKIMAYINFSARLKKKSYSGGSGRRHNF